MLSLAGLKVDAEALERLSPAEREAVRDQLRLVEEEFKRNPLLGYVPHGKQVVFHRPEAEGWFPPLRAFFGGNRSGKTTAAVVDTLIQCLDRELLPEHLAAFKRWDPPFYCRVMTPDLTGTMDGVVHEKIRAYCPPAALKGGSFDRAFDKVHRMLRFKNGSWIQFNSSEQEREKLGGIALHRVVYDEEPRQEARNECLTRLIDYDGEEIFALTPFSGMQWLFDEVYEPWERGRLAPADGRVVVVDMDDNPHLSESGKKRALAQYSGPEREARKSGRFVSFSGLIYPMFSDEHVLPAIERVPPNVEVFRSIDPGYRHMCAVGYYYLDQADMLVKFDEIALQGATVKQVCDEIRARDQRWGEESRDGKVMPLRPRWTVIDPAARNRNNQTGRSDQAEFSDNGVVCIPGQNAVGAGINRVKERLDAGKYRVCANCVVTIAQFRRYRWVKDTGRGEDEARERPVKKDDHQMDCDRYAIMQRPLAPPKDLLPESATLKDRLLRHHLRRLNRPKAVPDSGFGPGIFQ